MLLLGISLLVLQAGAAHIPQSEQIILGQSTAHVSGALKRFAALPEEGWDIETIMREAQVRKLAMFLIDVENLNHPNCGRPSMRISGR